MKHWIKGIWSVKPKTLQEAINIGKWFDIHYREPLMRSNFYETTADTKFWYTYGINLGDVHQFRAHGLELTYEEFLLYTGKWFVVYKGNTKMNRFFDAINKRNVMIGDGDYFHYPEVQPGLCSSSHNYYEKTITDAEFEIIYKIFEKNYDMKEEKEIIGYKLNGKVTAYQVGKLVDCSPNEQNGMFFWKDNLCSNAFKKCKELGILDLWFEPVYTLEVKKNIGSKGVEFIANQGKVYVDSKEIDIDKLKQLIQINDISGFSVKSYEIGCANYTREDINTIIKMCG